MSTTKMSTTKMSVWNKNTNSREERNVIKSLIVSKIEELQSKIRKSNDDAFMMRQITNLDIVQNILSNFDTTDNNAFGEIQDILINIE